MNTKNWIPWNFLIRRTARIYDVLDPTLILARMRRFSHPSEVEEPIELLRAGIVFHARGMINTGPSRTIWIGFGPLGGEAIQSKRQGLYASRLFF